MNEYKVSIPIEDERCQIQEVKDIISQTDIVALFSNYYDAFLQDDKDLLKELISNISTIAEKQPILFFPEFQSYNLPEIFINSLTIPDHDFHNYLLNLFTFLFISDNSPFLQSFFDYNIELCINLIQSISLFNDEVILVHSFDLIQKILSNSENLSQILLENKFIELYLFLFRQDQFSINSRLKIASLIYDLAQNDLYISEFENLLLLLRQILDDDSIQFLWPISVKILDSLIDDQHNSQHIMIDNQFYLQCLHIIQFESIELMQNLIHFFSTYFKYSNQPVNEFYKSDFCKQFQEIFQTILSAAFSSPDDFFVLTLSLIKKLVKKPYIDFLLQFDLFPVFKEHLDIGSYKEKMKIIAILQLFIKNFSNEQIQAIIVPFNFMENFIQCLNVCEKGNFQMISGIIARLLRLHGNFDPIDVFWLQFETNGGVELFQDLAESDDDFLSERADTFLKKIYSLRP